MEEKVKTLAKRPSVSHWADGRSNYGTDVPWHRVKKSLALQRGIWHGLTCKNSSKVRQFDRGGYGPPQEIRACCLARKHKAQRTIHSWLKPAACTTSQSLHLNITGQRWCCRRMHILHTPLPSPGRHSRVQDSMGCHHNNMLPI